MFILFRTYEKLLVKKQSTKVRTETQVEVSSILGLKNTANYLTRRCIYEMCKLRQIVQTEVMKVNLFIEA